jgi:hypothetical protein
VSYTTGAHYTFKANTANTGAASINLCSIGAKTIKKAAGGITTDLATNDIQVGQWVDVVYDGTNMQMQSTLGNAASGGSGCTAPSGTILPVVSAYSSNISADVFTGSSNQLIVHQIEVPCSITVNAFNFRLAVSGAASSKLAFGIYSITGNKLCALDNIAYDGSPNYYSTAPNVTTGCALTAGTYYFAWSATDVVTGKIEINQFSTPVAVNILNAGTPVFVGNAANAMSSGVLPSTLGTITANSGVSLPFVGLIQ